MLEMLGILFTLVLDAFAWAVVALLLSGIATLLAALIPSRARGWFKDAWYWFRCHTFTRYHIVDTRNYEYKWGWCDRCDILLYAAFAVLVDFVEKENPKIGLSTIEEWDVDPNNEWDVKAVEKQLAWEKEIRDLYEWWTKERPKDQAELKKLRGVGDYIIASNALDELDQTNLHRLVNVRQGLWT